MTRFLALFLPRVSTFRDMRADAPSAQGTVFHFHELLNFFFSLRKVSMCKEAHTYLCSKDRILFFNLKSLDDTLIEVWSLVDNFYFFFFHKILRHCY